MSAPIWFNSSISKDILYFPKWFKHGITCFGDVLELNGNFMSNKELENRYKLKEKNFLHTLRLKLLLTRFLSNFKLNSPYVCQRPQIPRHIAFVLSNKEKAKGYCKVLNEKSENIICTLHQKWQGDQNYTFEQSQWYKNLTICFKVIKDNNIIWFQYRLIHKILGTHSLLHKCQLKMTINAVSVMSLQKP